jgi:hypothetical protein
VIDPFDTLARYAFMIGITISGKAYSAIASMLPNHATERELLPDRDYRIWLPRTAVERLLASREELCRNLGDGVNQAADISWLATSIPSRNVTPRTILGN